MPIYLTRIGFYYDAKHLRMAINLPMLTAQDKMFTLNKISNAKLEWKTYPASDEDSSNTISSRAAHMCIALVQIRNYPPSPTPRPSPLEFLFQEFVKSSSLLYSLSLVKHRNSLNTNLDQFLEFGMDELSRKILFAWLAQEYHVSFDFQGRHCIQFGRRSPHYFLGKQSPWLWGKLYHRYFDQGNGKC